MPHAFELIHAQGVAVPAALTSLAPIAGDALAVRSFPEGKRAQILQAWVDQQTAGTVQIRSAVLHDNVRGIRLDAAVNQPWPLLPMGVGQRIRPVDTLIVEMLSGAVVGDIDTVALLLDYEDLPGNNPRLIGVEELVRRAINISGVENTIATGAAGGYSGSEAINAENDQFHARSDYALVGYLCDTEVTSIGWHGPDTSNLRVGGPGAEDLRWLTAEWFIRLSRAFNLPLIPVISAENKGATAIDAVQDENGADTTVISFFVELSPR